MGRDDKGFSKVKITESQKKGKKALKRQNRKYIPEIMKYHIRGFQERNNILNRKLRDELPKVETKKVSK